MGIDVRAVGGVVGSLLAVLSLTLLVPAAMALLDGDALTPFLVPLAGGLALGLATLVFTTFLLALVTFLTRRRGAAASIARGI